MPPQVEVFDKDFQKFLTDKTYRKKCILNSMKLRDGSLLFYLAVKHYNQSPTKSRAIIVHDLFLGDNAFWKQPNLDGRGQSIAIGDFNPLTLPNIGLLGQVYAQVAWYRGLRKTAQAMNPIARFFTSNERRATPGLFDEIIKKGNVNPGSFQSSLFQQVENADAKNPVGAPGWEEEAGFAKFHLSQNGFDVSALGMDDIAEKRM